MAPGDSGGFKAAGQEVVREKVPDPTSVKPTPRGKSVGRRAYEKIQDKNRGIRAETQREMDIKLSNHIHKSADGKPLEIAGPEEVEKLAVVLNRRMIDLIPDPLARSWYKLFRHMDDDGSGKIGYTEFEDMIRNELKISTVKLTEAQLHAGWRALDEDKTGLLTSGEFGKFMRKGEYVHDTGDDWKTKHAKAMQASGAVLREKKHQVLQARSDLLATDLYEKRKKAALQHDVAWGVCEAPKTLEPWRPGGFTHTPVSPYFI
eukprot:gnl/TRDRNA2_/TRDRNA2_184638_c0_seq1.p1 gnl/TRDRNA2_/TRDRNA2_184638_c0~~gnl/TRDRNA2_/TRDRNA2_184638_c0_seq1.p1  ORF type:complete len:278 (-),score=60.59 gnl/TRDRNA2_/TRDRNA2_184638_c0_seq1:106-888(-)